MRDTTPVNADIAGRPLHRAFTSAAVLPDGHGAAFAWVSATTGKKRRKDVPHASRIEAEYYALLSALERLPDGARVEIVSDSAPLCGQFYDTSPVRGPRTQRLLAETLS